jgi:hypothetical protein
LAYKIKTKSHKPKFNNYMKKILYVTLFTFLIATSITACTEEEVAPKTEQANGGGAQAMETVK